MTDRRKYKPRDYQREIHTDLHRFRVVVWHRRAGKSIMAVNEVIRWAKDRPGRYWMILPTYRQAKTVIWPILTDYVPADWVRKANESSLELRLFNGSEIALKGGENIESLKGVGLLGVVMDEFATMERRVWTEAIQPTLVNTGGWALFIGTPFGKNHFFDIYNFGKDNIGHPDWKSWHMSSVTSDIIPAEELERLRKETPQNIFEQEWEAKFLEGAGQVFRRVKENAIAEETAPAPERLYAMGVDLARLMDYTVISVIDRHNFNQVYLERFNQLDWGTQKAKIEAIYRRYNSPRTIIDATGIGDPVISDLEHVGIAIEGYKYTSEKKKLLVENLVKLLEQDKLKILNNDVQTGELEAFSYRHNPLNNKYIYTSPEGMFDDCVNALALSVWDIGEKLPEPQENYGQPETYFENPYE